MYVVSCIVWAGECEEVRRRVKEVDLCAQELQWLMVEVKLDMEGIEGIREVIEFENVVGATADWWS